MTEERMLELSKEAAENIMNSRKSTRKNSDGTMRNYIKLDLLEPFDLKLIVYDYEELTYDFVFNVIFERYKKLETKNPSK